MTIRLATNHRRITVEPMEPDFTFVAFAKIVMAYLVATTCAVSIGTFLAVLWIATP